MSEYFQQAYQRARSRFSGMEWTTLPPQQVTEAIYREMRLMDAEARQTSGAPARSGPQLAASTATPGLAAD